jgi:RHS repeat-associated protein
VGTPFAVHYRSDRVPGRNDAALEIPVTSAAPPAGLEAALLEVHVGGRVFKQSFPALPAQTASFSWDGLDAYGRRMHGKQRVRVRVGYVLPGEYASGTTFGSAGGAAIGPLREGRTYWFYSDVMVGHLEPPRSDLGGWSLSAVHAYDPQGGDLYLGDGRKQRGDISFSRAVSLAYRHPYAAFATDVAADAKGNLYIAYDNGAYGPDVVFKRAPDGTVTAFAGQDDYWGSGFSGDGGPATAAQLHAPMGVAVDPQGNVYIADAGNGRVRRVDAATGIISTVAGGGSVLGDGGPATAAQIDAYRVALDRQGNLYIASRWQHRIRKVSSAGTITTVAGTGVQGWGGEGGPATSAELQNPEDLEVDEQGNLYVVESARLLRVGADGTLTKLLGWRSPCTWEEGALLSETCMGSIVGVTLDRAGNLYYVDTGSGGDRNLIRMVSIDGRVRTVAGGGPESGWSAQGAPATRVSFSPSHLSVAPDGAIYAATAGRGGLSAGWGWGVFRVAPAMPGWSGAELAIPSPDGGELYRFSASGKHLETRSTLTGATTATIGYTPDGKLSSVTDGDGNVTTIQRDAAGAPTAIVGPYGQSTPLALDAQGWLASVTNPAGEARQFGYSADGLMSSMLTPRGHGSSYLYGAYGRITSHSGPDTATRTLALSRPSEDVYTVSVTSGEGKTTLYGVAALGSGGVRQENTFPTGLASDSRFETSATSSVVLPDGTQLTESLAPDPRWLLVAPYAQSSTLRLPSGLTRATSASRAVTLSDPSNPLSLTSKTETFTVDGKTWTTSYDAATRRFTTTSPAGRATTREVDAQGRTLRRERAGLAPAANTYDARGRLETITRGAGADARVTRYAYNAAGLVETITDPIGRVRTLSYDAAGRATQAQLPGGRTSLYGWDANGNMSSVTPPGRSAHLFSWTPVDLMSGYTPPDLGLGATTTSYQHNLDRRLTQITRPDGQTALYQYDSAGRLAHVTSPSGTATYGYSSATGRLTSIIAPSGVTLSYAHDGSLLTSTSWAGPIAGTVSRSYGTDLRVSARTIAGTTFNLGRDGDGLLATAGALSIARDPANGIVTGTTLGSVSTTRTPSPFGELAATSASAGGSALFTTSYTRDKLGRISQLVETVQGATSTWDYEYTAAGQLYRVKLDGSQVAEYGYDLNGNRLSATDELGATTAATYDAQDRILTRGTTSFTHSLNGELATKSMPGVGTASYSYDVFGNLTGATLPDGRVVEYLLDGRYRRVGKKVGGTLVGGWLYSGRRVVAELDGSGAVVSRFVWGTRRTVPEYFVKGGNTYRILADHLGSPRLVVDATTGAVVQRMDFDEWGRVVQDTSPGFQPFGFAGGLYDRDTGLVRFGARDYDPETGRWTTKDPILLSGRDLNVFAYAGDDPVNNVDPSGLRISGCGGGGTPGPKTDSDDEGDDEGPEAEEDGPEADDGGPASEDGPDIGGPEFADVGGGGGGGGPQINPTPPKPTPPPPPPPAKPMCWVYYCYSAPNFPENKESACGGPTGVQDVRCKECSAFCILFPDECQRCG